MDALPDRYRAEISDPRTAFAEDVVLTALDGDAAVGCLALTAPADGLPEIKRLWTDPAYRGRGIASELLRVRSRPRRRRSDGRAAPVWAWRTGVISLYERLGFAVTESWDERERLVCMQRTL